MNHHRTHKVWLLAAFAALFLAALAAAPLASPDSSDLPSPAQAVQQAWQRARDFGSYRFATDLSATAYPERTLASVGQTGRKDQMHLEGSVDLPARTLLLSLWQGNGSLLLPGDGVEIRIEGDQAYGRQAGGSWQEIDDFSGSFAPGGDLLVYLVGAKNVVELSSETIDLPVPGDPAAQQDNALADRSTALSVTYTRYAFDLDGPAMAEEVRQQWQRQLEEQGGLPSGVQVQAPTQLRQATGRGELWLDSQGLPRRLTVEIAYPPETKTGGGGRATIRTEFSDFPLEQAQDSAGWLPSNLASTLGLNAVQFETLDIRRFAAQAAMVLAVAGLGLLLVCYSRSRRVYAGLVVTIIFSMLVTPLAEGQKAAAFSREQAAQRAAYDKRQEETRQQQEYQEALHSSTWDPFQDPLAASEQVAALTEASELQASSSQSFAAKLGSYQVTQVLAEEEEPDPATDADLDTLTYVEEKRLGTDPDDPDSDGDLLRDDLEVKGFPFRGKTWHSDPLSVDTNNDGRPDLQECWTELPLTIPSNTPCNLDTNLNGVPGIFDLDDDGDGLEDGVDLSPLSKLPADTSAFTGSNPLLLKLDGLDAGFLTFVSLQIRPTNPEHLTYAFSVLDWPSGDTQGQVQRVLDTTFADRMTAEEIQKDPRSLNGDLRLIPMAEITVPYRAGHTRNLPVKPGWSGTLGATTPRLEEWVDMTTLARFGLTVRYADETGTVVIYAPLSLVSDETGGASVAFTTRLPYQMMDSGDWGSEHQVRVVWALQMLVDNCKHLPEGEDALSWCAEAGNREESIQIVHIYDESWVLTGLDVREDHGLEMGIAFEDPAHDADLEDDRNLLALAYGLDQTWIAARDCDTIDANGNCVGDGYRDLTFPDIVDRFDNDSNGDIPADDVRLWNIPKDALKVWNQDFAYQDLMVSVPMTYTQEILNQYFLQSGLSLTEAPTLMFVREEHYRSANLDSRAEVAGWSGAHLTLNLASEFVALDTLAAMNWAPYRYRDGAWEPYPIVEYMELLELRLEEFFPVDPNDPDGQYVSDGEVIIARGFYLGMVQGAQEVVQSGDLIYYKPQMSRDEKLKAESIKVSGNFILTIVKLSGEQIVFLAPYLAALLGQPLTWARQLSKQWDDFCAAIGRINKPAGEKGYGGSFGWYKETGKWLSRVNRLSIATLIIFTLCSTVLFILSLSIDSPVIPFIQGGLLLAANTIRFSASLFKFVTDVLKIIRDPLRQIGIFKTLWGQVKQPWSASVKGAFILTIIIEALIAIGTFIYSWAASHIRIGSLAWDKMLVDLIARIVVKTLLWALNFIPVIGKAIYLLISVLDSIVAFVCSFLSDKAKQSKAAEWLCGGISGLLSKIFGYLFYGQNNLVDLEDEERWQIGMPEISLGDPAKGFAVGNTLYYQLTLTNTLHLAGLPVDWKGAAYRWQYNTDNLKRSTFDYAISSMEEGQDEHVADLHSDLSLDQNTTEWELGPLRDGKQTYQIVRPVDTTAPGVPLVTAGVNITTTTYIDEGYAVPLQECIAVPAFGVLIPICWIRENKYTGSANLGESFPWDVFPESLDDFYSEATKDGGYSLSWGQSGEMPFTRQKEFDGDGLLNAGDGGPDPNDSKRDSDNDGLSDYFELEMGFNPSGYDADWDGLNDRDEWLSGTDPFKSDTDGDGLNDRQERDGWEFVYGFNAAGQPNITWVTSNPLMVDSDMDTLTDFQEYNYRYNPNIASDPNVLAFSSELSERTPSGEYATSDDLVRSGDQLRYDASVENKTLLSSAQGLHAARFPEDRLSGSTASRTFLLYPQEKETLSGDLSVRSGIPSGPVDLTQTAGARISYALADSDYAQLVLHLEDPSTATTFTDSSGNIPPHNGQCTGSQCPSRQVAGYMGSAVQFDATRQQVITAPDVNISAGDFGIAFWFKTLQSSGGLFSSVDGSVALSMSSGKVCFDVKVQEQTGPVCSPQVYADNQWHHLALNFANGLPNLYVDAQQVWATGVKSSRVNPSPQSGVRFGCSASSASCFSGLLDEVVVNDQGLTSQDVAELFGQPLLAMHLNEPAGATTFAEDGGLTGHCTSGGWENPYTCPSGDMPGVEGQSMFFLQYSQITVNNLPRLAGEFTLAAWILPVSSYYTYGEGILGRLPQNLNFSYPSLIRVGNGIKAAFGAGSAGGFIQTDLMPDVLTPEQWNHVVLTYSANQDGKGQFDLYVNGVPRGQQVLSNYPVPIQNNPIEYSAPTFIIGCPSCEWAQEPAPVGFVGQIDEVLIYPYALSQALVDEVYRNQADALHLPFDEPPGTYQFQDVLRRAAASCPADLATCPTAGVTGRAGQAAEFDGANDALDAGVAPAVSGKSPLSLAAWVRTTAAKNQVIVNQRSAAVYNGEYMFGLTAQGKVNWFIYGNSGAATLSLASARAVNDGKWHHVAAVRDEKGSAFIYIDGTLDATQLNTDLTKIASLVATNVYVGADIRDHAQYFDGSIDELHVVRRALSAAEVQSLVHQAPRFMMHFEEASGSYNFADDTELGHEATCAWMHCPNAGVKGQINLAAGFDGVNDILITTYSIPAGVDKTLMAWVKPDSTSSGQHIVLAVTDNWSWSVFRSGATWHVGTGSLTPELRDWNTGIEVQVDQWQHLAVTFSGNTARFFFNGHTAGDLAIGDHINAGQLSVGSERYTWGGSPWDGRIDEVAIYERALSDVEVEALWRYQGQWVQETHTTSLTVDNDKPVSGLASASPYRPDLPVNLLIRTSDATSTVAGAQWQVDSGAWQDAPPCDAGLGATWCPTFDPAAFYGPGTYTIHTRATDAAGNVSTVSSDPLYIDDSPPNVSTNLAAGALVQLQPGDYEPGTWRLPVSGTAQDPQVAGGVPGSGVQSLQVTLLDTYGRPLGTGANLSSIQSGTWNTVLTIPAPLVSGAYTLHIEAADQVGNMATTETHIYMDQSAPEASLAGLPPGGAKVVLHLDEAAGATRFADSSGYGHYAVCGKACPTMGLTGKFGKAVELNGMGQSLALWDVKNVSPGDFTLAAWFKSSSQTSQTILAASTASYPYQGILLLQLSNGGKVRFTYAPPGEASLTSLSSPHAFHDGQWHHAAAVRRGSELLLYVDGEIVSTKTDSRSISGELRLTLGEHNNTEFFTGLLDEVYMLPLALAGSEIFNLSIAGNPPTLTPLSGVVSEVPVFDNTIMALHLEEPSGTSFADSSVWGNLASCSAMTCPGRSTTGTFFGQALQFDGVDDRLSILNSSSLWSLQDNWTLSAWIRPDQLFFDQQILAYPQKSSPGGFGFGTHGTSLRFSAFGVGTYDSTSIALTPLAWQHVAVTLAGGDLTFYVDGVARQVITGTQQLQPNFSETDPVYVGMTTTADGSTPSQLFRGLIDEVTLFNRALSRGEMLALGAKKHAGVSTLEMAVSLAMPGSPLYNAPMPLGTQLYLPLDDTPNPSGGMSFLDISGQGHSGKCTVPTCPAAGPNGHAGGAALFDGMDDYVEIPLNVSESDYTLALWFKTGCADCGIFSVDAGTRGSAGFDRTIYLNKGYVCARLYNNETICTKDGTYADGQWHHVVHTFGGSDGGQKLYLDGLLQYSGTKLSSDFTWQDGINIGFSNDASLDYFNGLLDEVLLFKWALSAADVNALYLGTGTVLHLPLDEGWTAEGSTLFDTSGLANHAALHGANTNHVQTGVVGTAALQLDGANEYVTTAQGINFAPADYTVSGWFRTSAASQQMLLSATNPADDSPGIQLYLDPEGKAHFLHRAPTGSSGGTDLITESASNNGVWHHLAGVKSGVALTLYVDGQPSATGMDSSGFSHALDVTLGRQGKTTGEAYWNGLLDDVRIYARALSAQEVEEIAYNEPWKDQEISPSGSAVVRSDYITSLSSLKLEGYYRVDLRSTDTFGSRSDTTQGPGLWSGPLDSLAPRASLQYLLAEVGSTSQVHYQFTARDFGLVEAGMVSPCPASTPLTREYFNAPWYRALTGETDASTGHLYTLSGQCDVPYTGTLAGLTVCDAAGNCAAVSAAPLAVAALSAAAPAALASSAAAKPSAEGGVLILEPSPSTFITNTLPVQIVGGAYSPESLKTLLIRADRRVIDTRHWARPTLTDTTWTATWTPRSEGPHLIETTLRDWANGVYTDSVTVILDTTPPEVTITTQVITTTHLASGQITVTGTAHDANGIASVDVQARGVWRPAVLNDDGSWTATWTPELDILPDGDVVSGVVRAVDRAGWTALASADVYVDVVAPAPVDLALSYQSAQGTIPITQTGTTVREPGMDLQMAWTASSDGSGLAGYRAGWTAFDASGSATTWTNVSPGGTLLAAITPAEGQRLVASLGARDNYGNTAWQDFGPIYADSPLTPDYTSLNDPGGTYHGWMESGCTLLGTDRRISSVAPALAQRRGEQALYATWDSRALRLAWSGANWSAEGDLFIYLDTVPGGSDTVFDPFTPANALSETASSQPANVVTLSASAAAAAQAVAMLADYAVWVQDAQTAWLLAWDGSDWITSTELTNTQYRYQPSEEGGLTDLYLPFDLLGVGSPAANSLGLLAFATEEQALRLWSVLPRANPVTSLLAMGGFGHILEGLSSLKPLAIPMTHFFQWPSLAAGQCPNGSLALQAGQTPYPDADVQARLTVEPAGTVYHYMADHLYNWSDYLLGDKPLDFSGLLSFLDYDHPYVQDGQAISYSLHVQNSGQDATHDVVARIWSTAALTLPAGAPVVGDEHLYFQEIAIGDLAPGEQRTVSFEGRVDVAFARARYEQCLAAFPDRPRLCSLALRIAPLKVEIVDQSHTAPLERIWADHRIDSEAPRFAGISQLGLHIPASGGRLGGYAYDDSGVPELSLEIQGPNGSTVELPCPNADPTSGTWACDWDPTAANGGVPPQDGQVFQVRLQATDGAGLTGEPGPWQPFIVDTLPPMVTAQLPASAGSGLPVVGSTLRLDGLLSDNRGAAGVEVCLEGTCRSASTILESGLGLQRYTDLPATPLPLPACSSGEIQRTFLVADTFDIRSMGFGLRLEHPNSGQIRAGLISPAGTHVQVLSGERDLGAGYENFTVLLADAASAAVSQLGRDMDVTLPSFLHVARPDEPLSAFTGSQAAGIWTLTLCDSGSNSDEGSYVGSGLLLQPQNTAVLNGAWFQSLALPELDGVEQTVTVYGLDDAGNRTAEPWTHTFVVDNVPPVFTVTGVTTTVQMTPDLAPMSVLNGTVTDGGEVYKVFAQVHTPEGQLHLQPVTLDAEGWSFALEAVSAGSYTIYIVAEDLAGNQTSIGPFAVEVAGIPHAPCLAADPGVAALTVEPSASFSLTITAVISNTGSAALPAGLPVSFYVDQQPLETITTTLALQPGEAQPVDIPWPGAGTGDYDLSVLLNDPLALNLCRPPAAAHQAVLVRDLSLEAGWNLLSPPVKPFDPGIAVVQRPLAGRYRQIVGYDGVLQTYDPSASPEANTLQRIDAGLGYWVDLLPAEDPPTATLRMAGSLIPVNQPLPLDKGWNLTGYLPAQTLAITEALASIDGQYAGVLGFAGTAQSYYPGLDPLYNTLAEMAPGAGYWISATQAITLTYPTLVITPAVPGDLADWLAQIRLAEQTAGVRPFYQWMNFYGQAALPDSTPLPTGTVVLAVDPQDSICGATVVAHPGRFGLLACYGDDPTTAQDEGGLSGDLIRLVLSSDGIHPDGQLIGVGTWTSHGGRQEAEPPQEPQPPQVISDPAWQQVQYGDAITETAFTASDIGTPGASITAETFWSLDAGPWQPGLPAGLSLSEKACTEFGTGTSCDWRLGGQADVPAGAYAVELRVSNGASTGAAQAAIVVEAEATSLQGLPAAVQYSHAVTLTAGLSDDDGTPLVGKSLNFAVPGSCSGEAVTDLSGTADYLCESVSLPAGQVTVTVDFAGEAGYYNSSSSPTWLTVAAEQADVDFDAENPVAVPAASPGGKSGPFSLRLMVSESTPDAGSPASPGDISLAQGSIRLVPVAPGDPVAGFCTPGQVSGSGVDAILPVTCDFNDLPVNTYVVEATVDGGYYTGVSVEQLVVFDPSGLHQRRQVLLAWY